MSKEKAPALPKKIRVMGKNLRIYRKPRVDMPEEATGFYHRDRSLIGIAQGLSPAEEADTVLHEILHAIVAHSVPGEMDEASEEKVVYALASGLYAVLQDNPKFSKYLTTKR
jgi:Zn-dependent peptidase ImmA (M78 family)